MGVPESGLEAGGPPTADTLLTAFRTIKAPERARHESVLDYWLSIRGDKEFPPLHDLDPLEISDAGPSSVLMELIGGGQDAEIRHFGDALPGEAVQRIIDAPNPSLLGCIAKKLPIVAISRDFLAFEDNFTNADGLTRCWVTLLPLSSCGSWVDYVYAFVTVETNGAAAAKAAEPEMTVEAVPAEEPLELAVEPDAVLDEPSAAESIEASAAIDETEADDSNAEGGPGFSKLIEGFANLAGFYGQGIKAEDMVRVELPADGPAAADPGPEKPVAEEAIAEAETEELILDQAFDEPAIEDIAAVEESISEPEPAPPPEPVAPQPAPVMEGSLQSKLTDVRAKADEARMAQLRATAALHEGLSAAYDFALDAETSPEEYLKLVEAQGMKIQLRAPMAPVVKLAFNGLADDTTIAELETVLAWALKQELPRGSLAQRIEQAGGIDALLNGA